MKKKVRTQLFEQRFLNLYLRYEKKQLFLKQRVFWFESKFLGQHILICLAIKWSLSCDCLRQGNFIKMNVSLKTNVHHFEWKCQQKSSISTQKRVAKSTQLVFFCCFRTLYPNHMGHNWLKDKLICIPIQIVQEVSLQMNHHKYTICQDRKMNYIFFPGKFHVSNPENISNCICSLF